MSAYSFRSFALSTAIVLAIVPAAIAQPTALASYHVDATSPVSVEVSTAPTATLIDQTDAVLAMLWSNPESVATLAFSPERATADFARFALATIAATGPYVSHETLGAVPAEMERTYTYAQVQFEKDTVALRLTWKHGKLITITRGEAPVSPMLARF